MVLFLYVTNFYFYNDRVIVHYISFPKIIARGMDENNLNNYNKTFFTIIFNLMYLFDICIFFLYGMCVCH